MEENRLTRVASYRQLQALSHQINTLTGGRFQNLDAFSLPEGVLIRAVQPGEQRIARRDGRKRRVSFRKESSGAETSLLPRSPDWWLDQPLLILQMDQGPTCVASYAPLGLERVLLAAGGLSCVE